MYTRKPYNHILGGLLFGAVLLFLAACAPTPTETTAVVIPMATGTPMPLTTTPIATPTPRDQIIWLATSKVSATPPIVPTRHATLTPPPTTNWLVPIVKVPVYWNSTFNWQSGSVIQIDSQLYDATTGKILPSISTTIYSPNNDVGDSLNDTFRTYLSPDGTKTATLFCQYATLELPEEQAYVVLAQLDGQEIRRFKISGCYATWDGTGKWVSDKVFITYSTGHGCASPTYYNVETGVALGSYSNCSFDSWPLLLPSFSPDNRWHAFEENAVTYVLLDVQTPQRIVLSQTPGTYFQFLHWSADSSTFFVISHPADATAKPYRQTPFGLLAYDVATHEFTQLFAQVIDVHYSHDQQKAWVTFPAKLANGTLGVEAGVYDFTLHTLSGRYFISNEMIYANTGDDGVEFQCRFDCKLTPATWSNDGQWIVFGDASGQLTLLGLDGTTQILATNLSKQWWRNAHYLFSPNDQYVFVKMDDQAWVVEVGK